MGTEAIIALLLSPEGLKLEGLAAEQVIALVKLLIECNDGFMRAATLIITGIDASHPDWPNTQKAEYAHDAIRLLAVEHEKVMSDVEINALTETTLLRLRGSNPEAVKGA